MNKRSLLNFLLIITLFCALNAVVVGAPKAPAKASAKEVVKNAEKAAKNAKVAAEEAKDAVKDAKKAIKQARVINISLFATTSISNEKKEKIDKVISIVQPSDFKIESIADLLVHIQDWWKKVLKWFDKQQINMLVLFVGVLFTFIIVMGLGWIFNKIIQWRIKKYQKKEWMEQVFTSVKKPLSFLIFIIGVFLSSLRLLNELDEEFFGTILRTFFALMAFAITWGVYRLVEVLDHYLQRLSYRSDNNLDNMLVELIRKTVRFIIVFIAVLFIGQTILGLRITALVAGAGIVGLALALAAKDTLANFFGSVMIMLDKPFTVGERIAIDSLNGNVEKIGFRSTRIRSLNGHVYSIPNSKLADSIVENIAKRPHIKYAFDLTLVYDTKAVQMERAMKILHEILDNHEGFCEKLPPRIYFTAFNDWSLNIAIILWFQSTDYFHVQEWKNDINLEILRRFNAEGLDFAFPTSTNYLVGDENRELKITTNEEIKNKG